jgi:hypothetical protein
MNIERLFELALKNPEHIEIEYSNVNGKEKLIVNGEDVTEGEVFDDTKTKELVKTYKDNIEELDDDTFVEAVEKMDEHMNMYDFDQLLNKESYTFYEDVQITEMIDVANSIIKRVISDKINDLFNLRARF